MAKSKKWNGIETFSWQGFDWIKRPLWGINHTGDDFTYIDENMVTVSNEGCLVVDFKNNPKLLESADGSMVEKPYGRGYCRSVEEFKYGTFEWEMKCPYGNYMWPALWMSSDYSWPPEIDCMEGWSEKNPKYIKRLLFRNIKPTMHWTKDGKHLEETKNNVLSCLLKCGDKFDKYKVVWTPDYVKVFYNNVLVKKFTDKDMLAEMNKPEVKFHAIISVKPYGGFSKNDYEGYLGNPNNKMIVKSFRYLPF